MADLDLELREVALLESRPLQPMLLDRHLRRREFLIDNLLVRIHFIIVMIRWTGLAPWDPSSLCFLIATCESRMIHSGLVGSTDRGTARAEDAEGTPTQSHISPSILVYGDKYRLSQCVDSCSFWQTTVAQLAKHRLLGYEPCTILQGSTPPACAS